MVGTKLSDLELRLPNESVKLGKSKNREAYLTASLKHLIMHGKFMSQPEMASPAENVAAFTGSDSIGTYNEYAFVGAVAAGQPVQAQRDDVLSIQSSLSPETHVIVEVNGESGGDAYPDGSRWLVDVSDNPRTARKHTPAIFRDSQGAYLKIWDGKRFKSVDEDYPDVEPDEALKRVGYPVEKIS